MSWLFCVAWSVPVQDHEPLENRDWISFLNPPEFPIRRVRLAEGMSGSKQRHRDTVEELRIVGERGKVRERLTR